MTPSPDSVTPEVTPLQLLRELIARAGRSPQSGTVHIEATCTYAQWGAMQQFLAESSSSPEGSDTKRLANNSLIEPEGLEWERVTRAAWAINPDWSKRERQVIEDFILTVRCDIADVPRLSPEVAKGLQAECDRQSSQGNAALSDQEARDQ